MKALIRTLSAPFIALTMLLAVACQTPVGIAQTPQQKAFAAYGTYLVVLETTVDYCEDPFALSIVCDAAERADHRVQADVEAFVRVLRAGGASEDLAVQLALTISAATSELRDALVRHGVFTPAELDSEILRRQGDAR